VYDFLFVIIELFSLALTVETREGKSVEVSDFWRGWVTSITHFRWKGTSAPAIVEWQKTRRIVLSCGIKISPVGSLD